MAHEDVQILLYGRFVVSFLVKRKVENLVVAFRVVRQVAAILMTQILLFLTTALVAQVVRVEEIVAVSLPVLFLDGRTKKWIYLLM